MTDKNKLIDVFNEIGVNYEIDDGDDDDGGIVLATHNDHTCYFSFNSNGDYILTDINHFDGY